MSVTLQQERGNGRYERQSMPRDRYECFPILSCGALSWPTIALPCAVLFSPILSCNVLFCPVLSYPILYCPTLSCSVLFLFLSCPAVAVHCTHTTMQSFSLLSSYSSLFFSTLFDHAILARYCVSLPAFSPYALHVSPISTPALTPSRPVPSRPLYPLYRSETEDRFQVCPQAASVWCQCHRHHSLSYRCHEAVLSGGRLESVEQQVRSSS